VTEAAPRLCAIVPTFDAVETLPAVLAGVEWWGMPIIVVDDGSRDLTHDWLERWSDSRAGNSGGERARIVVTRSENGGKAAALRDGFARAIELGFDAAVTIDADGQHDPADAPRLIAKYTEHLRTHGVPAIVCGERNAATPGYPLRNLAGRRLNDLAIRAQTGVRVSDCPCGLRVYPLDAVRRVRCASGRFAWEEEFLTRAIWAGFGYERVPIRCIYGVDAESGAAAANAPDGSRAREALAARSGAPTANAAATAHRRHRSHYRFRRDWPEGIVVNLWLVVIALLPPAPTRRSLARLGRQVLGALSPARAFEHLVGDSPARLHGAAAMAIGAVGFGILSGTLGAVTSWPTWPVSTWLPWLPPLLAAWIVVRLHGSLLLALGAGAIAWVLAAAAGSMSVSNDSGAGANLFAVPFFVALVLLIVPSVIALRRRAP